MSKNCKKTIKKCRETVKNRQKYRKTIIIVENSSENRPKLCKTINKPQKIFKNREKCRKTAI